MILILSSDDDQSTNGVIDWIHFYGCEFIRINPSDIISELHIDENFNCSFKVNDKKVCLKEVTSFWYRRGHLNLLVSQIKNETIKTENLWKS
jgi:hypothetical protein